MNGVAFVIVQHAEKLDRGGDPGLTETGRRQAAFCAQALGQSNATALHSSPLLRAVETAQPIADALGLNVHRDDALIERMNWTEDDGRTREKFLADWDRSTWDRDYRPGGGDSSKRAGQRFESALRRYAIANEVGPIICISHGGVTVDLLRNLIGDDRVEEVAPNVISNGVPGGALTSLSLVSGAFHVDAIAALDHIAAADRTGQGAQLPDRRSP